jgi:two-component system OmpR family sensor kinase
MHAEPPNERDRLLETLQALLQLEATDLSSAMQGASELLSVALTADKVDVFIYEPASHSLVAVGTSDTPMGRRQHALGLNRLPLANGGRTVEVYEQGSAHREGHVDADPGELLGIRQGLGVRSSIGVPLAVRGERRGVLLVASAAAERFTDRDATFLGAVVRWVGAVAERAELVEALTRAAAEQGQRLAAEELVTVLAHDLRNHLTPLRGRLNLLQRRAQREQHPANRRDAAEALAAVEHLGRMIGELLDVARLEQGLFALDHQSIDLTALVAEAVAGIQTPETPIAVQAPPELIADVDAARARQALENLLANAVAHSPAASPVTVILTEEARDDGRWARMMVADKGPGIPPALLPHLFTRFAAGPDSAGLGLGLYLAHEIARAHGGDLTVQSSADQGACFTLSLPCRT